MDKKTRPIYMLPPTEPSQIKRYTQTKSKGMEKDTSLKQKGKIKLGQQYLHSTIDFKIKAIVRDKEGHYITIKGIFQHEDITLVNIYTPNTGAHKYVKQILMDIKGQVNRNTVIVGDFNTPLTSMDRSSRQKINKESVALEHTRSKGFH